MNHRQRPPRLFLALLVAALCMLAPQRFRGPAAAAASPAPSLAQNTYNDAVAAYALVRGPGTPEEAFSYNRAGAPIEVTSPVTGAFSVYFRDAAAAVAGNGHPQLTAVGANAHCMLVAWGAFLDDYRVDVICLDNNQGDRINSDFSLLILDSGAATANNPNLAFTYTQVGAPPGGQLDLTNGDDTYHPGASQSTLFHTGTGQYSVLFRDLGQVMNTTAHVQITPVLTNFMSPFVISCALSAPWEFVSGNLTIPVQCINLDGNPIDAPFTVLVTSGQETAPGFAYALNDVLDETSFTELTNDFVYNPWGPVLARRLNGLDGYLLHFRGLTTTSGGNIVVTPVASPGATCSILHWGALNSGEGLTLRVRCFNATRTHVDAMFNVLSTFPGASPPAPRPNLYLPLYTR